MCESAIFKASMSQVKGGQLFVRLRPSECAQPRKPHVYVCVRVIFKANVRGGQLPQPPLEK